MVRSKNKVVMDDESNIDVYCFGKEKWCVVKPSSLIDNGEMRGMSFVYKLNRDITEYDVVVIHSNFFAKIYRVGQLIERSMLPDKESMLRGRRTVFYGNGTVGGRQPLQRAYFLLDDTHPLDTTDCLISTLLGKEFGNDVKLMGDGSFVYSDGNNEKTLTVSHAKSSIENIPFFCDFIDHNDSVEEFNNDFILKNFSVVLTMASLDKYVNVGPSLAEYHGGGVFNSVKEFFNTKTDTELMKTFVSLLPQLDKLATVTPPPVTRARSHRRERDSNSSEYDDAIGTSEFPMFELLKKIAEERETT